MWLSWVFVASLLAVTVGLLLGMFERLRPSVALKRAFHVLVLAGGVLMLPVFVVAALDEPVNWIWAALVAGLLAPTPWMLRDKSRSRS
ncbi:MULTISPECIES: hypothetical protein [unclassified Micromonospora]|uniref:hypothetical protein n=1 Tax=unclassified Micromonospora TaxID=2617518 RepID=UPI0033315771